MKAGRLLKTWAMERCIHSFHHSLFCVIWCVLCSSPHVCLHVRQTSPEGIQLKTSRNIKHSMHTHVQTHGHRLPAHIYTSSGQKYWYTLLFALAAERWGQVLLNKVINSVYTVSGMVSLLSQVILWEFTLAICFIKGNEMIHSEEPPPNYGVVYNCWLSLVALLSDPQCLHKGNSVVKYRSRYYCSSFLSF